jgi:hypothetical protein
MPVRFTHRYRAGCGELPQRNPSSACFNHGSYIISNTATTIRYHYYNSGDRGAPLVFNVGDTFSIYRVFTALDQPGHGKGDLVRYHGTGHLLNATCGCRTWPHQQLEPCFSWNNLVTSTNTALGISAGGYPTELRGRDLYNLGTGFPPDSTPQLMATIYTAAVNGVDYTGPYVYPHPLVSAASGTAGVEVADFNGDGKPDYVLYNPTTRQTMMWYLNNQVLMGHVYGPTLWQGWNPVGVGDFNGDGNPDYLLYNPTTRQTVTWYLNNQVLIGQANGPTLWQGWGLVGVGDFNGDGKPDYLLYNPTTRQTMIWYLNNQVLIGHVYGPTLWQGWSLVGQ